MYLFESGRLARCPMCRALFTPENPQTDHFQKHTPWDWIRYRWRSLMLGVTILPEDHALPVPAHIP